MAFVFIKQVISKIVSSIGGWAFGKLSVETQKLPTMVLIDGKLDLSKLDLPPGTYIVSAVACAEGLDESSPSNSAILRVTKTETNKNRKEF